LNPSLRQAARGDSAASRTGIIPETVSWLDHFVFYGLIATLILTAMPYGTVDAWSQALFECAIFGLTLLWIVHGYVNRNWRIGNIRLLLPPIALVIWALAQSITWGKTDAAGLKVWVALSADPFETWLFVLRMSALILSALLTIRFTSNSARLGILVHAIIAVAVASALFGIARQAMQHGDGFGLSRLAAQQGFGQFINKNHFAFLIETSFGLLTGIAFLQKGRKERVLLYASGLLLMSASVVLSRSRGGLMAIAVQLVLAALLFVHSQAFGKAKTADSNMAIGWLRSMAVTALIVVVLLVVVVIGVVWLGGDQLATGVETASGEMVGVDRSELHEGARRRDIWRASWLMFKANPIVGVGLGGYWIEVPHYHSASGVLTPQQAHNDYLELLASGGIIAGALAVWFFFALYRQVFESVGTARGFQRAAVLGSIISLAGVAMHSIVDFGLHITINALVCMILLGILSLKPISASNAEAESHA
jgi:O-antigen ligase